MLTELGQKLIDSLIAPEKRAKRDWSFVVYPNPVKDHLVVDMKFKKGAPRSGLFKIYNTVDLKQYQTTIGEGKRQIDVAWLKPGIYIAKIEMLEGDEHTQRFIKH